MTLRFDVKLLGVDSDAASLVDFSILGVGSEGIYNTILSLTKLLSSIHFLLIIDII